MKAIAAATPSPMMHLSAIFTTIGRLQNLIDTFIPKNLPKRDRGLVDQLRERLIVDKEKVRVAMRNLERVTPRGHHRQLQEAWAVLDEELLSGTPDELRLPAKITSAYNMTNKAERAMGEYFEELDAMRRHIEELTKFVGRRHAKEITFLAIDMIKSDSVRRASLHTYERGLRLMTDHILDAGGALAHSERVGGTDELKAIFYYPRRALHAAVAIQREAAHLLRYTDRGRERVVGYRIGLHWAPDIIECDGYCPGVTPEWTTTFRIRDLSRGDCNRGIIYLSNALRKHIRAVTSYTFHEHRGPFITKRGDTPIDSLWELLWSHGIPLAPPRHQRRRPRLQSMQKRA